MTFTHSIQGCSNAIEADDLRYWHHKAAAGHSVKQLRQHDAEVAAAAVFAVTVGGTHGNFVHRWRDAKGRNRVQIRQTCDAGDPSCLPQHGEVAGGAR